MQVHFSLRKTNSPRKPEPCYTKFGSG